MTMITAERKTIKKRKVAPVRSKAKTRVIKRSTSKKNKEVVQIPPISIRLLEKAEIYRLYSGLSPYMSSISKVAGYGFVLFATMFISYEVFFGENLVTQTAALICSEVDCGQ